MAAREIDGFVFLESGVHLPTDPEHNAAILGVENVGVTDFVTEQSKREIDEINAKLGDFGPQVDSGDVTDVLAKIEALGSITDDLQEQHGNIMCRVRVGERGLILGVRISLNYTIERKTR